MRSGLCVLAAVLASTIAPVATAGAAGAAPQCWLHQETFPDNGPAQERHVVVTSNCSFRIRLSVSPGVVDPWGAVSPEKPAVFTGLRRHDHIGPVYLVP